jgi:Cu/Ag efflux protein CusF
MLRLFVSAVVALALCAGAGLAQDKTEKKAKNKSTTGTVKKVDATAGTLTVTVKGQKGAEPTDKVFTVDDTTKVTVFTEGQEKPKQLTGKDGLKDAQIKEGTNVVVVTNDKDKVVQIRVNPPKAKPKAKSN